MTPTENPYQSPQTKQSQNTNRDQALSSPEDNSIFNLDAAALGLLIVSSVEGMIMAQIAAAGFIESSANAPAIAPSLRNITSIVAVALSLRSAAIMAIAYFCMHKRRFYGLAILGAILPLFGVLSWPISFSIPFGIWALIRLLRQETRAAFKLPTPSP